MLMDLEQAQNASLVEADFIIIGGGIAGLSIARQLAAQGHDIAVLESGGEKPEERTQALYDGKATLSAPGNDTRDVSDFMTASRQRCLGGSGNVWGGKCAPLEPLDFERREWIPHSGWPVTRRQLRGYYDRACELLELPKFDSPESAIGRLQENIFAGRSKAFTPRPRSYTSCTGASPGPQYGAFKRAAIDHPRIRIYLHANVTNIQLDPQGRSVESLTVRCLNGRAHRAKGRAYLLATGGIENARLLLASRDVHENGVGNHSDWLGRGFLVHTTVARFPATSLSLMRDQAELAPYDITARERPHFVIGSSDTAQRQTRTGNFTATLSTPIRTPSASDRSVHSIAQRLTGSRGAFHQATYLMVEHAPNRDSRSKLSEQARDELGMPRIELDIRYDEPSLDTLEQMTQRLAIELGRLDAGRLQWSLTRHEIVRNMNLSRHHMGGTRMARSAKDGVVDADCRVHGVDNLYVAGSSVFPTSGIANPTLTLLALGFRLGDHLASHFARRL
jgi:choline dehydrogenase-like flavoprotein